MRAAMRRATSRTDARIGVPRKFEYAPLSGKLKLSKRRMVRLGARKLLYDAARERRTITPAPEHAPLAVILPTGQRDSTRAVRPALGIHPISTIDSCTSGRHLLQR